MAQAGVLGHFSYQDDQHEWALVVGHQLARYDLITGDYEYTSEIADAQRELVDNVNDLLTKHNINYDLPMPVRGGPRLVAEYVPTILSEMKTKCTPAEIACLLIGMANFELCMRTAKGDDPEVRKVMEDVAESKIRALDLKCPELQIDATALFSAMKATDCTPFAIRQLLQRLDFSSTNRFRVPITILCVSADARNEKRLRLGEEFRGINEALQASRHRDAFKLEVVQSCRPHDLGPAIRRHCPKIIHFGGHGTQRGLCFENEVGAVQTVDTTSLAELFKAAKKDRRVGLQGVLMNACYTEAQGQVVADAVGSVIAMEGPVGDQGAIDFARAFYGTLGDGYSFDDAFEYALAEARLDSKSRWNLRPRLIKANAWETPPIVDGSMVNWFGERQGGSYKSLVMYGVLISIILGLILAVFFNQ